MDWLKMAQNSEQQQVLLTTVTKVAQRGCL